MNHPVETTPIPDTRVEQGRDLLAGVLEAPLPGGSLLAAIAAYDHLDAAGHGLWPPPRAVHVTEPVDALGTVRSLLTDVLDRTAEGIDPYCLAMALRETAAALVLLDAEVAGQ